MSKKNNRSELITFIAENINKLKLEVRVEFVTIIVNSGISDKYFQDKTNGTNLNISKCSDELVEKLYNFVKSKSSANAV